MPKPYFNSQNPETEHCRPTAADEAESSLTYKELLGRVGPIGAGKKYFIVTLGCQMNVHDSEVIAAILEDTGYQQSAAPEAADLIVINTCAVRKKPEDKVASLLGKYYALKEENPGLLIAVGGCMAQQEDAASYLKERFHHLDLIFGTHALPRLPALLEIAAENKGTLVDNREDYADREGLPVSRGHTFQAWLPISYGCNNFCSYCVVPYVRGRERSRPLDIIIPEFTALLQNGYLDITLLGQNVNSYGADLSDQFSFSDLLAELDQIATGEARIRFLTSHPKDLSPQLIETVKNSKSVCEHFHLPVQSGSNRILELMNRKYTREHYLQLVSAIKKAIPDVSITTDIIVGFPGETEADFNQTLELLTAARFDNAFSFIYSPRKKTRAAGLNDQLSRPAKEERLSRLNKIQHRISKEKNDLLDGRVLEVLVEGASKNNLKMQTGRTRSNKLVHFTGREEMTGSFAKVRITEPRTWTLLGEVSD